MSVKVGFDVFGEGEFMIVGDTFPLSWEVKNGKNNHECIELPVNQNVQFKVVKIEKDKFVSEESNRQLFVKTEYHTTTDIRLELKFGSIDNFQLIGVPKFPRNGYILYRDELISSDPSLTSEICVDFWDNKLDADAKEKYLKTGELRIKEWGDYIAEEKKKRTFIHPLPPEKQDESLLKLTDRIGYYINNINPKWKSGGSAFIVFRDHPNYRLPGEDGNEAMERVICYRYQDTGSCFAHVACLEEKYMLDFADAGSQMKMIDMNDAIRKTLGNDMDKLEGGYTIQFLKGLFSKETMVQSTLDVIKDLHDGRPLVVSNCVVDVTFQDRGLHSHLKYREPEKDCWHALTAIGHRTEGSQDIILLQNTWEGKQFVEMSLSYLLNANCTFSRVLNPKRAKELKFLTNVGKFSEMNCPVPDRAPLNK